MKQKRQRMIVKALMTAKKPVIMLIISPLFVHPIVGLMRKQQVIIYKDLKYYHKKLGVDLRVEQRSIF